MFKNFSCVLKHKIKTNNSIKKFKKILIRTIIGFLLFLLLLGIALSLPFVQTKIAGYATKMLNDDFGTNINIEKVAISIFGSVKLKGVLILDHHNDTLISADRIQNNLLSFRKITDTQLLFGTMRAQKLNFHLKTYRGEENSNLDVFVKAFDDGKPGSGKFRLTAKDLIVSNGRFRLTNENAETPRVLDFKNINGELEEFFVKGSDVGANIKKLSLKDHRGLLIDNMNAGFTYTKTNILLENLDLKTKESHLQGFIKLFYKDGDFQDFTNKVVFDVKIDKAAVSSNELNYFYNEFGEGLKFYFSTYAKGPLNNFVLHGLNLVDNNYSEIIGTINFKNLFTKNDSGFYLNGNFTRITSDDSRLRRIMPRVLGNSLPTVLSKFGQINMAGNVVLTKTNIDADLQINSGIGRAKTKLSILNFDKVDNAVYKGIVDLDAFHIGRLIDDKSIGITTLNLQVDGKGFSRKYLNTVLKGNIRQLVYNKYNYKNIKIDGRMKWPYFEGFVNSNDPNLIMDFDGVVDVGRRSRNYDFHARVDYADLSRLNFIKNDTLAIFKGDLQFKASGNDLDDLAGKLQISQLSYQNSRDSYYFEDFFIESVFDENQVRTITVNSQDIVEGRVVGKYEAKQIPKLLENALGSLYTNYSPHEVNPGQFLEFNFTIYNKIVEIILPEISVGQNTRLRGIINADREEFRMSFDSPNIDVYKNYFSNVKININNKNPLYNAYIQMDSVRNKNYKISDFSLINVTMNDTLYLRSEFKGGNKATDDFNLNLYYTIDKENRSVVGLKKSEIKFKEYQWYLNENDTDDNKLVFNKKLNDFSIEKVSLSHNHQKMELEGVLKDSTYKDIRLVFNDVELDKIVPTLDSLNFGGRLNGFASFKQNRQVYEPTASITVDNLKINKHELGNLDARIAGDEDLRRFNVNTSIVKDNTETFFTNGLIEVIDRQTVMNLDAGFSKFDISPLELFLNTIFPDIRGVASGRATIRGPVKNPEIDGRLYLQNGGLKVGYLNTDFDFEENSIIDITEDLLFFRNMSITDVKHKTQGSLNGSIKHNMFKDWVLDLRLDSDRLLVLDTQDSDDALYYGTAFIKGRASIYGPVSGLVINVAAESVKGTDIKIPITNTTAAGNVGYINFLSPQEKENLGKGIIPEAQTFRGLEMNFELDVTPDATIEIIIDKNTGHSITANGYGTMLLDINTLGKFNMWGDFQVDQGQYNFRYAGLFDKKFTVKRGGSISWYGDPTRARLNIEAIYNTQANPSVLLENPNFNRNIPVQVTTYLVGDLINLEYDFAINFPNASSVLKSDLEYRLSDMDTRKTQALSLLTTGSFLSPTNANTAVYGSLFERASSLFNDLFSDEEGKVRVGVNYVQADRNPYVETSSQIGVTLSSQINERITVNGQLGVPVGGVNESVIVGNVEVQLRLNEDGTLKARVFNRENDINFLGEGIGYTQGLGLTYEVDFDTFKEFVNKVFKNVKIDTESNSTDHVPDSDFSPEYIKFMENRNKKKPSGNESSRVPDE